MPKSQAKHNRFYRTTGRYNFADPSEEQAMYVFTFREDAPEGLRRGFVVDIEHDWSPRDYSALEVARELQAVYDRYFYTANKQHIAKVVAYLETCEAQDAIEAAEYEVARARERLAEAEDALARVRAEFAEELEEAHHA